MSIAHVKIPGLDEARIVALVEPVLSAHGVDGVELLWKTDSTGWVLTVNIEKPGTKMPGEGITVDLCSDISRDISAALDVDEVVIPHAYRLEVGSPGIERHLYLLEDYRRFAGRTVKARLRKPVGELRAFRGKLSGVNEESQVVFVIDDTSISSPLEDIMTCRLVFEWDTPNLSDGAKAKSPKPRSSDRARSNRSSKRNR